MTLKTAHHITLSALAIIGGVMIGHGFEHPVVIGLCAALALAVIFNGLYSWLCFDYPFSLPSA